MIKLTPKKISRALTGKGFESREGSNHEILVLWAYGKKTTVRTFLSRGTKEYKGRLESELKKQLRLTKEELYDLIECPLSESAYLAILEKNGHIRRPAVD